MDVMYCFDFLTFDFWHIVRRIDFEKPYTMELLWFNKRIVFLVVLTVR